MPSTSKKQHNFMAAVANNPAFAKKVGVPQGVGQEFTKADKGKTFKEGGRMATMKNVKPSAMGKVKTAAPSRDGVVIKGHTKGKEVKMAGNTGMKKGGMAKMMKKGGKAC
ncbi:MAG: hypothetical protein RL541_1049 [Pseudomonadota bacterium]|jgi:hypothetical protein